MKKNSTAVPEVSALKSIFPESKDHELKSFFRSRKITFKQLSGATGFSVSTIHQSLSNYRKINPDLEQKLNAIADQIKQIREVGIDER